jgi:hypothetical protein
MKRRKVVSLAIACLVLAFGAATVQASDPVGIYAIVEKVVLEPGEAAPQRVQIWGAFALADQTRRGDHYLPAARGYLYYTLKPGDEAACRAEWSDLEALAGTGQAVGFGSRYLPKARVRKADEKAENPDTYETEIGLQRFAQGTRQPRVIAGLQEALASR